MADKKVTIIADTAIAGEHVPTGSVVTVNEETARLLIGADKAVEGDQSERFKKAKETKAAA